MPGDTKTKTGLPSSQTISYSVRVGASGQIVIQIKLRQRFHFQPGDVLVVSEVARGISVRSYDQALVEAQAYFQDTGGPALRLVEDLLAERRTEVTREAAASGDRNA